jgi:hypothetical protein
MADNPQAYNQQILPYSYGMLQLERKSKPWQQGQVEAAQQ